MISFIRGAGIVPLAAAKPGVAPAGDAIDVGLLRADADARREVIRLNFDERGLDLAARRDRIRTARVKPAA